MEVKGAEEMLGEKLMTLRKKNGYSQQELADKLSVTRQTISNWELGQGAPALDKAAELAKIYNIKLDDLIRDEIEIISAEHASKSNSVLKALEGKQVRIDYTSNLDEWITNSLDWGYNNAVRVVEVNDYWIRIEYERSREGSFRKKETVVKLLDLNLVLGFEIVEGR